MLTFWNKLLTTCSRILTYFLQHNTYCTSCNKILISCSTMIISCSTELSCSETNSQELILQFNIIVILYICHFVTQNGKKYEYVPIAPLQYHKLLNSLLFWKTWMMKIKNEMQVLFQLIEKAILLTCLFLFFLSIFSFPSFHGIYYYIYLQN